MMQVPRTMSLQHMLTSPNSVIFRMMRSLVLVEHKNERVEPVTRNTIKAAQILGYEITALIVGDRVEKVAKEVAETLAVSKVLVAKHSFLCHQLSEQVAQLLKSIVKRDSYSHVWAPGSTYGKNILPRAAASLNVQPVSDVVQVVDKDTFVRPIYAGNALATVQYISQEGPRVLTVRPSAFPVSESGPCSSKADILYVQDELLSELAESSTRFEGETVSKSGRPELGSAKIVVCGGRALKSAKNFQMLDSLADVLGGAVGASRAAVDAGFVPNNLQVGQTGKVVAPDLYIGVGISGAIQHLAGMKDSKTIVAINTDPEAPIFQVADYGLVQDLFTAIPAFEEEIKKLQRA
ncbi:hypothetical protein CEUSTIGMA_g1650.t1 [Chlamydomonas eustigma]|uniref:Electron transfer flavoprotein subunit alpha n=1 Tax=Chlamydomonas eustigma TaxID=1157962 RepID=A0A250WTQ9_9CHLO|nr:hypothetical protein CEUSTIGMA_g1650.t1 [Chlamydomonas eustigma]|eukprot:GAX74201.1 hypothetical protein CEUSTIGMA_g1650.t1 [Chlamydomonas eustigma]